MESLLRCLAARSRIYELIAFRNSPRSDDHDGSGQQRDDLSWNSQMPTTTIANVLIDELKLILTRREHAPRPRARPGEAQPVNQDAAHPANSEAAAVDSKIDRIATEINQGEDEDARMMLARRAMLDEHVTGLSLSGGGIRAGTFAVGFLQGIANLRLLGRFDYLSTVSGGGYAGGWLAAWLKRDGDVKNVERQLDFSHVRQAEAERGSFKWYRDPRPAVDEEPEPLRHLRAYSSYLFPQPGPLSVDTWTVIVIWLRNVLINLLMLFPLAMLTVLAARLGVFFFNFLNADDIASVTWGWFFANTFLIAGLISALVALNLNASSLPEFRGARRNRARTPRERRNAIWKAHWAFILTIVGAFCITVSSRWMLRSLGERLLVLRGDAAGNSTVVNNLIGLATGYLDLLQLPSFLLVMTIFAAGMAFGSALSGWSSGSFRGRFVGAAAIAGASSGFLFVLVLGMISLFARTNRPDLMALCAIPGALAVVTASIVVEVAISGRAMTEAEREWWGRFNAKLVIASILWVVVIASALYLPGAFLAAGAYTRVAVASGWLGTTALGVLSGRFMLPRLRATGRGKLLATVAAIAPPIFLIGLLGLIGLLASLLLNTPGLYAPHGDDLAPFDYYLAGVRGTSVWMIVLLGLGFGSLAILGFKLIDVNLFSLNAMYANRLIRCYLGASRRMTSWHERWDQTPRDMKVNAGAPSISLREPQPDERDPNPLTRFDPADDLPLSDLRIGAARAGGREYWGPHLLVNTTLNLVGGSELAWRSRKGESFLLSSLYCGAKGVGYVKIDGASDRINKNLTLGRAMSISGAAVDPNMRFYQSRALSALLALFNARLGSWMQNPRMIAEEAKKQQNAAYKEEPWSAESPRFGGLLMTELLGKTDGTGEFVHLSDGGHFDNMGVYELIRRRCRYIVALDAGDETGGSDSNLAMLIRLCRIDFGIRIQIDTSPLSARGADQLTKAHAVTGSIRYDDVDQGQLPGVLVYVKISMTGDEPPDLQNYARNDTNFPHQPTDLRQSFDEEQFECYRCLGDHIACELFGDAANRLHELAHRPHTEYVPLLFSMLQSRLYDAPELEHENFVESTQAWITLQRDLRSDPNLARLSRELYTELPALPEAANPLEDPARAECHAVSQMLQIMENTWLSLGFKRYGATPLNRGWVNVFRRWVNTPAFQRLWPSLRPEYGSEFCRFCEEELHLASVKPEVVPIQEPLQQFELEAIAILKEEFEREWAAAPAAPAFDDLIIHAKELAGAGKAPPVWLIVQPPTPPLPESAGDQTAGERFVTGIILCAKLETLTTEFPGLVTGPSDLVAGSAVELFVWMRRSYRSTTLGTPSLRDVLETKLPAFLGTTKDKLPALWARYPKPGEHGESDREWGIWLSFLAQFGFRRCYARDGNKWNSTLLKRQAR
jgi:Patatin-like phospholipase